MSATRNQEGLEVNPHQEDAAKAPEVDPRYFYMHNRPSDYVQVVQQKKLPFGWSLWALLTLAAVISAVIIGAGVGAGLGVKLADCKKSEPSSAPTETTENTETTACTTADSDDEDNSDGYAPKLPQDIVKLTKPAECAERGGPNEHRAIGGLKFKFYCGMDAQGSDKIKDLAALVTYTFDHCVDACEKMNELVIRNNNGSRCDSLVFGWQMSKAWDDLESNCWLKSGTSPDRTFNLPQYIYAETPE
ncbi:hypothetical protein FALBO_5310 [Fusarium albosuccineum]|uniref:Apple domain-containing protein n=1 Tax=Fusarium albosuccineum TaxID=1237068 RepID=A0A8H4PKG2_9HYPO|nr:hypothetical protein FALBO_5310 [Fusarium albosuccineum]